MADETEQAIRRNQARAKKKGTRAAPRRTYLPSIVDNAREVEQGARTALLRDLYKAIDNQAEKDRRGRKFQTRGELEAKVRAEARAGKIPRGQIGATVDRRFKATAARQRKFLSGLRERVAGEKEAAREQVANATPGELGIRQTSALVQFRISNDVKEVSLTFSEAGNDLYGAAGGALARYMHLPEDDEDGRQSLDIIHVQRLDEQ